MEGGSRDLPLPLEPLEPKQEMFVLVASVCLTRHYTRICSLGMLLCSRPPAHKILMLRRALYYIWPRAPRWHRGLAGCLNSPGTCTMSFGCGLFWLGCGRRPVGVNFCNTTGIRRGPHSMKIKLNTFPINTSILLGLVSATSINQHISYTKGED